MRNEVLKIFAVYSCCVNTP